MVNSVVRYNQNLTVTCLSAMFSALIEVTAFINETQVFMYDNSNFIINPQYIYIYLQVYTFKHVK